MTEMRDVILQRGGEVDPLKLHMYMAPGTPMPTLHSHPEQIEFFQVIDGIFEIKLGRKSLRLGPGEHVTVPTGALHAVANSTSEPAIVYTEITPGLKTADFFETLSKFQDDGWMA